jgi:hypothetical protein
MHEIQHRLVKGEKDKDIMSTVLLSEKKLLQIQNFQLLCYYI